MEKVNEIEKDSKSCLHCQFAGTPCYIDPCTRCRDKSKFCEKQKLEQQKPHELKTWPKYFDAVWEGVKPWEYRKNDRDYQIGDLLILKEWMPERQEYTDREIRADLDYMLQGGMAIAEGYAILSLGDIRRYISGVRVG